MPPITATTNPFSGIIAHRGSSKKAPENTMASFRQAHADGADAIELDISYTRDGKFAVIHDGSVNRTTNGWGRVSNKTMAELKSLDAGSWFSDEFRGETIPELPEVLDWAKGRSNVVIEAKRGASKHEGTATDLISLVESHEMKDDVTVMSFERKFVEEVEETAPEINTALLFSPLATIVGTVAGAAAGAWGGIVSGLSATVGAIGVVGGALTGAVLGKKIGSYPARRSIKTTTADNVVPHWYMTDRRMVRTAAKAEKNIVPWVVNSPRTAKRVLNLGVNGLITDVPHLFTPR